MKGNWRDEFDQKMLGVLRAHGVTAFLQTATSLLNVNASGATDVRAQMVGELCEVVLQGLTEQYFKDRKVEGKFYHSVVLPDLGNMKSSYRTELDAVIATPYFILTTECKSYKGSISLRGKGSIVRNGSTMDVYKQSLGHHKALVKFGEQLVIPGTGIAKPPIFANGFIFSNGEISDDRSSSDQGAFTFLTLSSLYRYYDEMYRRYTSRVFDMEKMHKVFTVCSESVALHAEHKSYLGY